MVVRHRMCRGRGSVYGMGDVCRATFYVVQPCCATKIANRQMSVYFKRNSCDIMVSERCCVLSDVIWTYFCHFLRCSRAKFIKKIVDLWTMVAQQLFAWSQHVLCRTTLLYKVVWLNCCLCGRTLWGDIFPVLYSLCVHLSFAVYFYSRTLRRLASCVHFVFYLMVQNH